MLIDNKYNELELNTVLVRKLFIIALKYKPVVSAAVMLLYLITPLTTLEASMLEWMFSCFLSTTLVLFLASYVFKFCIIHRLFVLYSFIVYASIMYLDTLGISKILPVLYPIYIIIGIILFILPILYKKYNIKNVKLLKIFLKKLA